MLGDLTELARSAVTSAGYPGVLLAMVAESVFPPIPSEIVLPLAGFEVSEGELMFGGVVLAATAGSLLGALLLYALGRYGGRPAVARYQSVLRLGDDDLARADTWFARWGDWVVLGARVVPLARSAVSVPAGMLRMPLLRFSVLTVVGSLVWNLLLVGAGVVLGRHWDDVGPVVARFGDAVLVVGVVACVVWVVRRRRRR